MQIVGARRPRRVAQFSENRGVPARDLNQALTDIVAQNRETWDKLNDVTGRAVLAPPGETLAVLASAASRKNLGACFDNSGNLVSCVSIPSSTLTAGNGITLTGTNPTTITNNIQGSGPITITGTNPLVIGCATCNTQPVAGSNAFFVASRATAATLDLHTFSVIHTGGYASAGDGGGATFKNVGSTAFKDTFITSGSVTSSGTGYANGTYNFVGLSSGSGFRAYATIVVAGGAVTSVTITEPGFGYAVGDVLSAPNASIGGSGSGFTWTVSAVSTTGSFVDSVGTHFQIVVDDGNWINVRQFGAVLNWAGTDGSATDDTRAFQNALWFASYPCPGLVDPGSGGCSGQSVYVPAGTAYFCTTTIVVPVNVTLRGSGRYSSSMKMCNTGFPQSAHFIELCDKTTSLACFGVQIRDMELYATNALASSNYAMIYSNNVQDGVVAENLHLFTGQRGAIWLETGYGGASYVTLRNIEIDGASSTTDLIHLSYGTTIIGIYDTVIANGASGVGTGIHITGGFLDVVNFHCELLSQGIFVDIPTALTNGLVGVHNATGNSSCTNLVTLSANNKPGNFVIGRATPNGSTRTVFDGQSGGTSNTGTIVTDTTFNP
ncbi:MULTISPECIES: hypothetical protein [unclassified Bradyrhizobium]